MPSPNSPPPESTAPASGSHVFLDPYPVPSHRAFREGYLAHSRFAWSILELPPENWRWRLRAAGARFARQLRGHLAPGAVVMTSSMLNVAQLRGLLDVPLRVVQYWHENQLTYARSGRSLVELALIHAHSLEAADVAVFNSAFHRDEFAAALATQGRGWPGGTMAPDLATRVCEAEVVWPGVTAESGRAAGAGTPPLLLWNHRWCPEKGPEVLLRVLQALVDDGLAFRVAVVGSPNEQVPEVFGQIRNLLGEARIAAWGFQSQARYRALLREADIVLSTAREENFGLAMAEAAASGALPLAPAALAYPEWLPASTHAWTLYADEAALRDRLRAWLRGAYPSPLERRALAEALREQLAWPRIAAVLDGIVAGGAGAPCRRAAPSL